ncbi:voltage-gated chloride channel-like protein [Dehalogenimonas lykanthroporepellens BL-DC-9]|nr:voltage-gated chloride channel-like protein [Dehalogenimonas lykanthroporepellens BL-DC-9]
MKNTKLWTLITAGLAILAGIGGGLSAGEGGSSEIHVIFGVLTVISAIIAAYSAR